MTTPDNNGTPTPPPAPAPTPPPAPNASDRTFSQEDVNRIAAREKDEGQRSREKAILDALGVASLDDAKQVLADKKAADEAKLSEVEKREKAASKIQEEAVKTASEAATTIRNMKIEAAIMEKLLGPEQVAALKTAATLRRLVDVEGDADDKAITSAVEALATTMPHLFQITAPSGEQGSANKPPVKPAPGVPPTPSASGKPNSSSAGNDALTILHQRHPHLKNKTK